MIATCFGLCGFAAAVVAGIAADNQAGTVIVRACVAMVACYLVGRAAGAIAQRAVEENIRGYKETHPIPDLNVEGQAPGDGQTTATDPQRHPSGVQS